MGYGLKRAAATSNLLRKEPARDRGESKLVLREGVLGGVAGGVADFQGGREAVAVAS